MNLPTPLRAIAIACAIGFIPASPALHAQLVPSGLRIREASSENTLTGELARHAVDGNLETQWHTRWHDSRRSPAAAPPHVLTLDTGAAHAINAVRLRGRAHGEGGLPREYSLELGLNGDDWTPAAAGTLAFRGAMSPHAVIELPRPVSARFLRLTVRSLLDSPKSSEPGLVLAELEVATPDHPLLPTTLQPVPQSREWNYGGYDWRQRHQDLLSLARRQPVRLVFIGDSITHQWGAPPHDVTPRPGEAVWQEFYAGRQALNLGYGWDRVENMLWRLQDGELDATDAELVVVLAGTNNLEANTPADIAAGVTRLCDEIHRRKPDARILLLAVFPRGKRRENPDLEETNHLLRPLGGRPYITFKDIGSAFLNDRGELTREIMPDLLHLSPDGYRRWARAIEPEVAAILGPRPEAR